jgi:prevent-host-death family protein
MTQVTIHEAKTHLSRLIAKVMRGEEVVIAKRHQPVVRLVLEKSERRTKAFGALPGLVLHEAPDCWEPGEPEDSPTDPLSVQSVIQKKTRKGGIRKAL